MKPMNCLFPRPSSVPHAASLERHDELVLDDLLKLPGCVTRKHGLGIDRVRLARLLSDHGLRKGKEDW